MSSKQLSKLSKDLLKDIQDDKIERIKSHYLDGLPLSPEDEETRLVLEEIFRLAIGDTSERGKSKTQIRKFLEETHQVSGSHAYYLIRQTESVFGKVGEVDKEGLRVMQTERYLLLYNKALDLDNLELANSILLRIDSVNGLLDRSAPSVNIERLLMLPSIERTTDPEVLNIPIDADDDTGV